MAVHRGEVPDETADQRAGGGPLIALSGVEKTYRTGALDHPALRGVDLEIGLGEMVSIGPSTDIRRIFRTEALALALGGWLLAIPLGWLIGRTLVAVVVSVFHYGSVPYRFPLAYLPVALAATVALAAVVVIAPVHRAARLKPGDALRYE